MMPKIRRLSKGSCALAIVGLSLLSGAAAGAQTFEDLEGQVREFTLDNGMHFLVVERKDVPVFSFTTYVNAGSSDEVTGITGIAHILEHMAFKGTREIGTADYKKEQKAMAAEDEAFRALKAEREKGTAADPDRLAQLEQAFEDAKTAAREFVVSNEFGQIVENNGGRGLNAGTWTDATEYYYSFPANRLELWAYLEGTRMTQPVLREFYTEKDGPVTEERRMRTDNSPIGMLIEQFQNLAFMAHPYHHSTIGYMSDLNSITRQDCQEFYERHYVGQNMVCAVVGDVAFTDVERLARKYFADVSAAEPPRVETVEPPQQGERREVLQHTAQPIYALGYHIGSINDRDWPVYEAIADILGQGRTSRLYKVLVKEKKMAVQAAAFAGFPDNKYPTMLGILGIPVKDVTALELEEIIFAEIDKLVADGVTPEELAGVKRRAKANFVRSLRGNLGLAQQLTYYQVKTGDWHNAFRQVAEIEAVTVEDVQRVAEQIFKPNNRTVVYIETVADDEG
jgi:predicted Zn-dependent peptidase